MLVIFKTICQFSPLLVKEVIEVVMVALENVMVVIKVVMVAIETVMVVIEVVMLVIEVVMVAMEGESADFQYYRGYSKGKFPH